MITKRIPKDVGAPFAAKWTKDIPIFFRTAFSFWQGMHFLRHTKRAVTFFGSARVPMEHDFYQQARATSAELAKRGFTIITGGGPSLMQAANQGAHEAGGKSIGVNIQIPHEQGFNPFVTHGIKSRYFFVRKVLLARYSEAFVVYPGGFGTLDELFEIITLLQTGKMINRPVVLVGREFWSGLLAWCRGTLLAHGMINEKELNRIKVVDTTEEVIAALKSLGLAIE
jgi:uncharacterized protein (TIGR00730 family)